jgi:hypothetical protein
MTKKLPEGDDGSRMSVARNFHDWPGDPFAGMQRKWGQTDYECNQCGRVGRHPWSPDVPPGWWWLHDANTDIVHIVCSPKCAAAASGLTVTDDIKMTARQVLNAGWHYRRPEKRDPNEPKATGLGGGWNSGSV